MIILFDLDSTLCSIEGCDIIAERNGVWEKVRYLTQATMDGEMDFASAFPAKTDLVAASKQQIQQLATIYIDHFTNGIVPLIRTLQANKHRVGIITQWYQLAADLIAEHLWLENDLIVGLQLIHTNDGTYQWILPEQDLLFADGKARIIQQIVNTYPQEHIVMIGDSVSDMKTQGIATAFIWCGIHVVRKQVQQEAEIFITDIKELEHQLQNLSQHLEKSLQTPIYESTF